MARSNLNSRYDYRINRIYQTETTEADAIDSFTKHSKKNWDSKKNGIKNFKKNIRKHLEAKQKERCAYCRQYLQSSGKGEDLDHIVAKDTRPQWTFISQNLVLSCSGCNTPKNACLVLNSPFNRRTVHYPDHTDAFKIYNPYYDQWSHHFVVTDDIFIRARPNSKGDFTISTCQLYREQVIINNIRELNLSKGRSKKKITHGLYGAIKGTAEYSELKSALKQIIRTS